MKRIVFAVLAAIVLSGCLGGETAPEKPPVANIKIQGMDNLNPTAEGESTPVVLHLYALKRASKFRNAGFFPLYDAPAKTLGADLVSSEQITVRPGESLKRTWVVDSGIKYIGALAAFRNIDRSVWQDVREITGDKDTFFYAVTVGDGKVRVETP